MYVGWEFGGERAADLPCRIPFGRILWVLPIGISYLIEPQQLQGGKKVDLHLSPVDSKIDAVK